jgi:hypothetical protein
MSRLCQGGSSDKGPRDILNIAGFKIGTYFDMIRSAAFEAIFSDISIKGDC